MKIKGSEYYRLHPILTQITSRVIWRHLKDNTPIDKFLDRVPDEFDNWVKNKIKTFYEAFDITKSQCLMKYLKDIEPTENLSGKEVAEKILKQEKSLQKIYFNIYNNKDFSQLIWKKLYPTHEKPFTENDNEGDI
jgi:RNA ligase